MKLVLCLSARNDCEIFDDKVSITQVSERLDIQTMLERAASGILDLNSYETSSYHDVHGDMSQELETKLVDKLNEPDTPLNRVFGVDRETYKRSLDHLLKTVESNKIIEPAEEADKEVHDAKADDKGE